jgi:hypothetical protein
MPRKVNSRHVYAVKGGSFKSFLNSINNFLKKTKIVSTVGKALAPMAGVYSPLANAGVNLLASKGYGKKKRSPRKRTGGALRLAGGAVRRTRTMRKVNY